MSSSPKTVCVESPFRNPLPEVPLIGELYREYLHDCLRDSLSRGEAPFAGHAYLPLALNDDDEAERRQGIDCHLAWLRVADVVAVYTDFGVSSGMVKAMGLRNFERRCLPAWADVSDYVRGFVFGWHNGPDNGSVDGGSWDRGYDDGARRESTRFRP